MRVGSDIIMNIKPLLFLYGLMFCSINCWATESVSDSKERVFVVKQGISAIEDSIKRELLNTKFSISQSTSRSAGVYFDSPELVLLDRGAYLRFEALEYRSKKKKKTKFHKTVQYSTANKPFYQFDVKHYKSVKTFEGKHPLIGLVKRKQRPDFMRVLESDGFKYPLRLKEIAKVTRASNVFKVSLDGVNFVTVTVNKIRSIVFDKVVEFDTVSIKGDKANYNDEYAAEILKLLEGVLNVDGLDTYNNEYSALYDQLENNIDFFKWLLKYPFLVNLVYSLLVGIVGVLFIWLMFMLRTKAQLGSQKKLERIKKSNIK